MLQALIASFTSCSVSTRSSMYCGDVLLFERGKLALADDDRADHGHEQEERRHFERHEIVGVQRHADRLGVADDFAAAISLRTTVPSGLMHFAMAIGVRRAQRLDRSPRDRDRRRGGPA